MERKKKWKYLTTNRNFDFCLDSLQHYYYKKQK